MVSSTVEKAIQEAQEFIKRAEAYLAEGEHYSFEPSVARSALRRKSMDLTRVLADLRQRR